MITKVVVRDISGAIIPPIGGRNYVINISQHVTIRVEFTNPNSNEIVIAWRKENLDGELNPIEEKKTIYAAESSYKAENPARGRIEICVLDETSRKIMLRESIGITVK